jgi:hypothetical protein
MPRTINDDITEIRSNLNNLLDSFNEFKEDNKRVLERLSCVEISQARQAEKISNWNLFQASFSVIVGVIATYLGAKGK